MRLFQSSISIWALINASAAFAQSDEPFLLGTIVIQAEGLNEVGVDAEDLARTDPSDLQDVFKGEPAVSVGSSVPASQKIYVNGVEENNLAVTIDGARQNNKIFHHNATTIIDPELLKQVRVDPGVAPADAGPGALAGALAFETKDAADLLAPGRDFGAIVSSEYKTNGDVFSNSATAFARSGPFEVLGFLKFADGGTRQDGAGNDITGSGTNLLSGLAKGAVETASGHRVELSYEYVQDDDLRPFRADFGGFVGNNPTRVYDLRRQNVVASYTTTQSTEWWDPKVTLAFSVTDLEIPEETQNSQGKTASFNGVVQNTFEVGTGTITTGIDFYVESAELDFVSTDSPEFNDNPTEEARNVGVFAQGRYNLTDRARVSAGARVDVQEFEGIDGTTYLNSGLSGNASAEFDVTQFLTVSAGASRVWGGVALSENFILNSAWVYPDDSIDPVISDNLFAAANASFGPVDLKAKVFRTNINDARTPSFGGGPNITSDLDVQGFELGATYNWATGFVRVGYANIDSEVNGIQADSFSGRYLTTPLGEQISLEIAHEFPDYGVTVGADAQIALERTNLYNFGSEASPLPSYEVVNLFTEYTPSFFPHLTIRGEVNNVFDELYADHATYGQEFVDSDDLVPLYEPGRSFSIRGTVRF